MLKFEEKFNLTKFLFEGNNISIENTAVIWNNIKIKRKNLYDDIIKTSDYLLMCGVKPNERIVLLLNDTPAIYEFFLGAIAIGAIPVLINPKTKISDISYILNNSMATMVISEIRPLEEVEEIFKSSSYIVSRNKIIIQDRYVSDDNVIRKNTEYFYPRSSKVAFLEEEDRVMSFILRDKDAPAFWQYTSGTTGKPKAVIHSQLSMLSNSVNFAENTLSITSEDCIYSIPKMFFGYGLGNSLFFPLWTGATAIIDDRWPLIDNITNLIKTHKPTVFFAVPKIYGALLKYDKGYNYNSIRIFYSAGSNLHATLNTKWNETTGRYITQGIGCTEIGHVYISTKPTSENINATGKPVQGFNVRLDTDKDIGELYVKPSYKLLGYYGDKDLKKFSKDNWYKTCDNFKRDNEDCYIFSSRVDDLFKVNGRMVVPSIIEDFVIKNYPVNEAVFVALEDDSLSDVTSHLCLVLADKNVNKMSLIEQIQNDLRNSMSSYMCPHYISIFDNFEYNSNGKIIKNKIVQQLKLEALV